MQNNFTYLTLLEFKFTIQKLRQVLPQDRLLPWICRNTFHYKIAVRLIFTTAMFFKVMIYKIPHFPFFGS
ncbi:hypothetical protein EFS38_07815 [Dickeya undicola]|uniref:Uncharacterized protein n=1 Tax=Dickeya undicola TaxID=1577887 RepID=A0ABX9WXB3_9GAMM|nr:hypothetical protein EFS38_07815 [Dickeya undicola]